jgi:undecaprenyl-diphosphatase
MMTAGRRRAALMVIAGSFAILLALVWTGETNSIDTLLRNWALRWNDQATVAVWKDISLMGSVAVISGLTTLSLGAFLTLRDWLAARLIMLSMLGAVPLETTIKWIVQRPRPDEAYFDTMPTTYSFPSGHALYSFMFYLTIAAIISRQVFGNWRWGVWCSAIVIVALVGASRIFLGVHYGSDVLGGYLIAAIWMVFLSPEKAPDKS